MLVDAAAIFLHIHIQRKTGFIHGSYHGFQTAWEREIHGKMAEHNILTILQDKGEYSVMEQEFCPVPFYGHIPEMQHGKDHLLVSVPVTSREEIPFVCAFRIKIIYPFCKGKCCPVSSMEKCFHHIRCTVLPIGCKMNTVCHTFIPLGSASQQDTAIFPAQNPIDG